MEYTIKHGSIAALQHVTNTAGEEIDCIFMSGETQPEAYPRGNMRDNIWVTLPLPVRAAVNRQFGSIFSLPYDRRQAFIDSSTPFVVQVDDLEA